MSDKWKEYLLKSSLPLELIISKRLHALNFIISGEYTYVRLDRNDRESEFSIDIDGFSLVSNREDREDHWASLEVFIECKYSDPSTNWVFTPKPADEIGIPTPVRVFDHLTTRRFPDFRDINSLERDISSIKTVPIDELFLDLPYCLKGIKLYQNVFDTEIIDRGFSQLAYAIPSFIKGVLENQISPWNDEDLHIAILCPILVTTSPLLILNEDVDLVSIRNAKELSNITSEIPALLLHRPTSVALKNYANRIYQTVLEDPEIYIRLQELNKLCHKPLEDYLRPDFFLHIDFFESLKTIIIVNEKDFIKVIHSLLKGIKSSYKYLYRVGYLKKDLIERKKYIDKEK